MLSNILENEMRWFNQPFADENETYTTEQLQVDLLDWVREIRNAELLATDKYMGVDFPVSDIALVKIKEYRAALRDLPNLNFNLDAESKLDMTQFPITPDIGA